MKHRSAASSKTRCIRGAITPVPTLEELQARVPYQERTWGPYTPIPLDAAHRAVRRAVREAADELTAHGARGDPATGSAAP